MPTPNAEDIYWLMGFTLSHIQSVERNIKFVTIYVLQDGEELTLEKLQSIDKKESKKALGYFISKVKERAELFPKLKELMKDFLKNRNDFIHNQDKIPGWDLDSPEGLIVAKNFTITLLRQAHKINEIFAALVSSWQEQTGMYPPEPVDGQEYIRDIEERYGAFVDIFFTAKET